MLVLNTEMLYDPAGAYMKVSTNTEEEEVGDKCGHREVEGPEAGEPLVAPCNVMYCIVLYYIVIVLYYCMARYQMASSVWVVLVSSAAMSSAWGRGPGPWERQ